MTREEIASLPAAERLALIADLWDSLTDADLPLPPAQRTELQRRLDTFDDDCADGITWEHLRSDLATRKP